MKKRMSAFAKAVIVYTVVALVLIAIGLAVFWDFIACYERSRQSYALDGYLSSLTAEYVFDASGLYDRLDAHLEKETDCRQIASEKLRGGFSYVRYKQKASDGSQRYGIFLADTIVGAVTLSQQQAGRYGFAPWEVTGEEFDLSFLLQDTFTITVPRNYTVMINGALLDESYITDDRVPYEAFGAFYEKYELPAMAAFTAGPFLSAPQIQVYDETGAEVNDLDPAHFLDNCTEDEIQRLEAFADTFVHRYVRYTGSANRNEKDDYLALMYYVVYGSELGDRLYDAMLGLGYAQSFGDQVVSVEINRCSNIGNEKYFLDLTYVVNTWGHAGMVQTTSNCKVIVTETVYGLKAENLISY